MAETPSQSDRPEETQNPAAYRVLARKYRPQTFDEVLGQEPMVQTLSNAFGANRIAQAYMLTGVRGIGKTTTARLIARALNYVDDEGKSQPTTDFNQTGEHCQAIMESRHVDVIEMDAASHTGIGDVREIIESVRYKPVSAPYKVYIIDEVHMLSKSAFNALLKTLEEPPEHVKFIFATTEIRKVPITVLSRCQRFDLRRLDAKILVEHFTNIAIKEGVEAEQEGLQFIARACEGSVRDGLSLLDQAIAYGGKSVLTRDVQKMLGLVDRNRVVDLFQAVMAGKIDIALENLNDQYQLGADPHTILNDFAGFVHWVTRIKVLPQTSDDATYTETERVRGKEMAEKISMPVLTRAWQMALKGLGEVATSANALMATEMVFIRLAYAADLPTPENLVKKLDRQPNPETGQQGQAQSVPQALQAPMPQSARQQQAQGADFRASNVENTARHNDDKTAHSATQPRTPTAPAAQPDTVQSGNVVQMMQQTQAKADDNWQDQPQPAAEAVPKQEPFSQFGDIIALASKMRDVKLKLDLEKYVRPIRVSKGKIEIALENGASPGLAGELSRKMESWTGERWVVLVAKTGGQETIKTRQKEKRDSLFRQAQENDVVKSVFETFPGAQLVDVRDVEAQTQDSASNEFADEYTGSLDEQPSLSD